MATSPPQPAPDLPACCTLNPEDDEMLSVYLRCKIAGEPLPGATAMFFHDADIYAADPATLIDDCLPASARSGQGDSWFFFSPVKPKNSRGSRKSRTVGDGKGTWHSERARKGVVDGEGRLVGYRQSFSYKPKNGDKSEWLMTEFGVDQEDDEGRHGAEPVPVLCKIYRTPRTRRSASNPSSSGSARKRNATDERPDQPSPAPVRRRLFPSPPAPTPPAASQDKNATCKSPHDFLMSVESEPEAAEESQGETSTLDHGLFLADHAHCWLSCFDTPVLPPCAPGAATSGSWTGVDLAAFLPADDKYWRVPGFAQDASYWGGKFSALDSTAGLL